MASVVSVGAATALVGTFLPWVRIGSRSRSSYLLLGILSRLRFTPGGPAAAAVRLWPLVPLLLVSAVVVAWSGRRRVGGAITVVAAVYVGGLAAVVTLAPVAAQPGVPVALAGSVVLLVAAVLQLTGRRQARSDESATRQPITARPSEPTREFSRGSVAAPSRPLDSVNVDIDQG